MSTKTFEVYKNDFDKFEKAYKKMLSSRFLDIGQCAFSYSDKLHDNGDGTFAEVIEVTIENFDKLFIVTEWQFVAVLEDGIIYKIPEFYNINIPNEIRKKAHNNHCTICNIVRNRNKVFILHNKTTNEWEAAGTSCVEKLLGVNPIKYLQEVTEFDELILKQEEKIRVGGNKNETLFSLQHVFEISLHLVKYMGYISRSKADESFGKLVSTGNTVKNLVTTDDLSKHLQDILPDHPVIEDDIKELAREVINNVKNILENKLENNQDNDFVANMYEIMKSDVISYRQIGIAAYIPVFYMNEIAPKVKPDENNNELPLGNLKKVVFVQDDPDEYKEFYSDYGMSLLVTGIIIYNDVEYKVSFFLSANRKDFDSTMDLLYGKSSVTLSGNVTGFKYGRNSLKRVKII